MNIRKICRRLTLVAAAVLWAGCGDDNGTSANSEIAVPASSETAAVPESSGSSMSSAEEATACSSSEKAAVEAAEACKDQVEFPVVVDGSDLRCKQDLSTMDYNCCDGSIIQEALPTEDFNHPYDFGADKSKRLNINDTLFTEDGVQAWNERNKQLEEEAKEAEREREALALDSLNQTNFYCVGKHGGVQERTTFKNSYYTLSNRECTELGDDSAKTKIDSLLQDSTLAQSIRSCLKEVREFLEPQEVAVYGTRYARSTGSISNSSSERLNADITGTVTCGDGTVEETANLVNAKKDFEESKAKCRASLGSKAEEIDECMYRVDP